MCIIVYSSYSRSLSSGERRCPHTHSSAMFDSAHSKKKLVKCSYAGTPVTLQLLVPCFLFGTAQSRSLWIRLPSDGTVYGAIDFISAGLSLTSRWTAGHFPNRLQGLR